MPRPSVLIVDDDASFRAKLRNALEGIFVVESASSVATFWERFVVGRFEVIIVDVRLEKGREGLDLLRDVLAQDPAQAMIVITAYADSGSYADALQSGALTYLDKAEFPPALIARTVDAIAQQSTLRRQIAALSRRLEPSALLETDGVAPGMRRLRENVRSVAEDDGRPALLVGEAGTGVEIIAANIHRLSRASSEGPFIVGNCSRLDSDGFLTALFGAVGRGPRGNSVESKGWIDEAKGGMLLLYDLPVLGERAETMVSQLLAHRRFRRIGGGRDIEADVQILIAAIVRHDAAAGLPGAQRIIGACGGLELSIPPLREREEDIAVLAQSALQALYREGRTQARSFDAAALSLLESLPWPGNLRELRSAVEYAAIRADVEGVREIGPEHVPQSISAVADAPGEVPSALDYQLHLARAELGLVESAIGQLEIRKKGELARTLRYRDRFTFSRRIRRLLRSHQTLAHNFPNTVALFESRQGADP